MRWELKYAKTTKIKWVRWEPLCKQTHRGACWLFPRALVLTKDFSGMAPGPGLKAQGPGSGQEGNLTSFGLDYPVSRSKNKRGIPARSLLLKVLLRKGLLADFVSNSQANADCFRAVEREKPFQ